MINIIYFDQNNVHFITKEGNIHLVAKHCNVIKLYKLKIYKSKADLSCAAKVYGL